MRAETAQQYLDGFLPAGKTVNTAKASFLVSAVIDAVTASVTGSGNGFTPAELAEAALQPDAADDNKVRSDRNTSGPEVAAAAVGALVTGSDTSFDADAAAVVDGVVTVNGTTSGALSTTGKSDALKDSLEVISNDAADNTALLYANGNIGNTLATDPTLEALPSNALTSILETGIGGVTGQGGHSTLAPLAANSFVAGILEDGSIPNVATVSSSAYATFAVNILKNVYKNTSVVELVANQVGLKDSNLTGLATALYAKYSAADAKITQGLLAVTATSTNQSLREADVSSFVTANPKVAAAIAQGAVFDDPYHTYYYLDGEFSSLSDANLKKYAATIATDVGQTLGQDGDVLTNAAQLYGNYLLSGSLQISDAGAYVKDLISGAEKGLASTVPVSVYPLTGIAPLTGPTADGGKLSLGSRTNPTITPEVAADLASILDVVASSVAMTGSSAVASDIGALAKDVFGYTKDETISTTGTPLVAVYLANSLAAEIKYLDLGTTVQNAILTAFENDVKSELTHTVDEDVITAVSDSTAAQTGEISVAETDYTNL